MLKVDWLDDSRPLVRILAGQLQRRAANRHAGRWSASTSAAAAQTGCQRAAGPERVRVKAVAAGL
jgi:hypothetical protein